MTAAAQRELDALLADAEFFLRAGTDRDIVNAGLRDRVIELLEGQDADELENLRERVKELAAEKEELAAENQLLQDELDDRKKRARELVDALDYIAGESKEEHIARRAADVL